MISGTLSVSDIRTSIGELTLMDESGDLVSSSFTKITFIPKDT